MAHGPLTNVNLGQLLKDFGSNLWDEIKTFTAAILGFMGSFINVWDVSTDDFDAIKSDFDEIRANVQAEIAKLKTLHDPKWKTRVIHVPSAFAAIHDLVELIRNDLFDRAETVVAPIHSLVLAWRSEKLALESSQEKPNALARATSWLHSVETAIHQTREAMDAAKDITELAIEITDMLNGLDLIFLQQGNPRIRVKGTISAREGKIQSRR